MLKHPKVTTRPAPEKLAVTPRFGLADRTIPRHEIPVDELDPETAYQVIHDELMLDGNARMNAATFVTTWMEPQATRRMNGMPRQEHDRQGRVPADGGDRDALREHPEPPVARGDDALAAVGGEVTWRPAIGTHGPNELPLRFPVPS